MHTKPWGGGELREQALEGTHWIKSGQVLSATVICGKATTASSRTTYAGSCCYHHCNHRCDTEKCCRKLQNQKVLGSKPFFTTMIKSGKINILHSSSFLTYISSKLVELVKNSNFKEIEKDVVKVLILFTTEETWILHLFSISLTKYKTDFDKRNSTESKIKIGFLFLCLISLNLKPKVNVSYGYFTYRRAALTIRRCKISAFSGYIRVLVLFCFVFNMTIIIWIC